MRAEVIAIGDELVSGQRLDTNSQWLSSRLAELGIEPQFHSTVGDDIETGAEAFGLAAKRSNMVVTTGGIGPTKDDLTRMVLAQIAGVELEFNASVEKHIRSIFRSYGREMPENNRIQAYFPAGSRIIDNREGTAPGIDLTVGDCRFFVLPGVPYEMKEMWNDYVSPAILQELGRSQTILHHTIHCFGAGESQIELMLDGMTDRNHVPRVGITASQATISLRITTFGNDENECQQLVQQTSERVSKKLGGLVFGINGETLADVICKQLAHHQKTIAVYDWGFGGAVGLELSQADVDGRVLVSSQSFPQEKQPNLNADSFELSLPEQADMLLAISAIRHSEGEQWFDVVVRSQQEAFQETMRYAGHSGLRESRTIKQVLNVLRLNLTSFLPD